MTISKTAQGTWRVRVDVGYDARGKRVRKSGTFAAKRDAQAAERLWSECVRTGSISAEHIMFCDFVEHEYLPEVAKRVRHNTLYCYQRDIRLRLMPAFGDLTLDEITPKRIQAMINGCATHKVAKNARDTLRQILNHAVALGLIQTNSATNRLITLPKQDVFPDQHNGEWLTTFAQHQQFLEQMPEGTLKMVAALGLGLGLRKGEIFALDWEDVDLANRLVRIRNTYVMEKDGYQLMPPKTYQSRRTIPIHKALAAYLEAQPMKRGPLVRGANGKRANPKTVSRQWMKYVSQVDTPRLTILNLRHSFATACLNANIDITKVSKFLGHTNIQTTVARYVRYKPEEMVTLMDKAMGT